MTIETHLTPADVEARFAGRLARASVAALVSTLRADPHWSVTEFTLGGRLVQVELVHHPSGEAFTLSAPRDHARGT